ncbi:MAG TPA: hypothetical protein VKB79_29795 [Bryobacteraceae bacterium]|nr:hypothetical protein [Bryobacteraceae bacterium]
MSPAPMLRSVSMKLAMVALLGFSSLAAAKSSGTRVLYVGGTVAGIPMKSDAILEVSGGDAMRLTVRANSVQISYKDVNTLEYGMRVSRRYVEAIFVSPVFLIAKRKTHFLTIGYSDSEGKQQALVLKVGKEEIRVLLVTLEARTGRAVEYQDEEARKAGKG